MDRVPAVVIRRVVLALVFLQGLTAIMVVHHHPPRDLRLAAIAGVVAAVATLAPLLHRWACGDLPPAQPRGGHRRLHLTGAPRHRSPETPAPH